MPAFVSFCEDRTEFTRTQTILYGVYRCTLQGVKSQFILLWLVDVIGFLMSKSIKHSSFEMKLM